VFFGVRSFSFGRFLESLAVGENNRGISPLRLRFGFQNKTNLPDLFLTV
jgi:hypothetical protein